MADHAITVFLAEDNLLVRAGVQALLSLADDIEIVGGRPRAGTWAASGCR